MANIRNEVHEHILTVSLELMKRGRGDCHVKGLADLYYNIVNAIRGINPVMMSPALHSHTGTMHSIVFEIHIRLLPEDSRGTLQQAQGSPQRSAERRSATSSPDQRKCKTIDLMICGHQVALNHVLL